MTTLSNLSLRLMPDQASANELVGFCLNSSATKPKARESIGRSLAQARSGIETLTTRTKSFIDYLAMSMTRRRFIQALGQAASALGLTPKLPQLPNTTNADAVSAIQILNSRKEDTLPRLIRQFLDTGHDDVWNHIVALSEENSVVAAEKLLNMIKTLPLREDFARVSYAALTNDFSKLTHLDWGPASFLIAMARDDKFSIYVEPLVEKPFLYKHFVSRTGITPEHFGRLLAVKEHCGNLPTEIADDDSPPRAIKTNPLSPYMAYLLRTNARAEGAREHLEEIEDGYQAPSPPRGD